MPGSQQDSNLHVKQPGKHTGCFRHEALQCEVRAEALRVIESAGERDAAAQLHTQKQVSAAWQEEPLSLLAAVMHAEAWAAASLLLTLFACPPLSKDIMKL